MAKPNDTIAIVLTLFIIAFIFAFWLSVRCLSSGDDASTIYTYSSGYRTESGNGSASASGSGSYESQRHERNDGEDEVVEMSGALPMGVRGGSVRGMRDGREVRFDDGVHREEHLGGGGEYGAEGEFRGEGVAVPVGAYVRPNVVDVEYRGRG
ncbi:hypothetical protein F5Y18DRAFT_438753 [Xylariaceae sp. FL1019]|nr:hypothetical protein F5Y18DRAFT_438753 [Xylariaceae sp. FL1019]